MTGRAGVQRSCPTPSPSCSPGARTDFEPLIQHDRHRPVNTPNQTAYRGATASPTTPATRERS